jgi:hypothetical protein
MAASAAVLQPTPAQIVRAMASAVPAELSNSPLLGILGVIMGAGIVALMGRMLTLGLADLKGHVGISYDAGAWIGSAFNVALMFIGPFTVYLGGLMRPHKILFAAATAFTVVCVFLPFIHNYSLLIVALVLAGLTSGTFYPLTLTFALPRASKGERRGLQSAGRPLAGEPRLPHGARRARSDHRSRIAILTHFPNPMASATAASRIDRALRETDQQHKEI